MNTARLVEANKKQNALQVKLIESDPNSRIANAKLHTE